MIKKYHKGLRKTENFCQITSWELTDGTGRPQKEVQGQRWYRQMHLLDEDAFDDKKPDQLIQNVLNSKAHGKNFHFVGRRDQHEKIELLAEKELKEAQKAAEAERELNAAENLTATRSRGRLGASMSISSKGKKGGNLGRTMAARGGVDNNALTMA